MNPKHAHTHTKLPPLQLSNLISLSPKPNPSFHHFPGLLLYASHPYLFQLHVKSDTLWCEWIITNALRSLNYFEPNVRPLPSPLTHKIYVTTDSSILKDKYFTLAREFRSDFDSPFKEYPLEYLFQTTSLTHCLHRKVKKISIFKYQCIDICVYTYIHRRISTLHYLSKKK